MKQQPSKATETVLELSKTKGTELKKDVLENPAIQRALRRLKDSQVNDNHVSHYTKHSSHSVKHSSTW